MSLAGLIKTQNWDQTVEFGREFAQTLSAGAIVCINGELGAGKTTLVKGIVSQLTSTSIDEIESPTYTYLNIYSGEIDIYHFDLYRIKNEQQFLEMGFDEYFEEKQICLIEWATHVSKLIPKEAISIEIECESEDQRIIRVA